MPTDAVLMAGTRVRFVPMTVEVRIGEVCVQPLVDTGAGVLLIHTTTLQRLQAQGVKCMVHQWCSAKITGINSNKLAMLGFVQLPISLGSMTWAVKFCIVPACPALVLLGTRALHKFGVAIQFEKQELVLPGGVAVPFLVTAVSATQFRVFLSEELVLDPRTMTRVHTWVMEGPTPWMDDSINLLVELAEWGGGLKTARVAWALADRWCDGEGKCWTVADMANFSTRLIWLLAGTPLAKAKWVEDDWVCSVVEPGVVEGSGTPFNSTPAGYTAETKTPVRDMASEGTSKAPYHNTLSWEPVATATTADINGMVSRADNSLSAAEVEHLQALLTLNHNVFTPALHAPGQAQHKAHQIEVEGHQPIKVAPQHASPKELVVQKTEIRKMLAASIMQPSHSLWASPVVLVTKKDRLT
jgi:hypothetical protein